MKKDIAECIVLFMELEKEDIAELMKLKIQTLDRIYEHQRTNALAYQHMHELHYKKK